MMRSVILAVLLSMTGLLPWLAPYLATAAAQTGPPLQAHIEPWGGLDGVPRPYRFVLTLEPTDPEVEVVVDHRLLTLELWSQTGRRPRRLLRCTHPDRPRRTNTARIERPGPSPTSSRQYRQWVDLRMFCGPRVLELLETGLELRATYGYRRRARRYWVAKRASERRGLRQVVLEPLVLEPLPPLANTGREDQRLEPRLSALMVPRADRLRFSVSASAPGAGGYVFAGVDAWSFVVEGPQGMIECSTPSQGGPPSRDLYRRLSRRRRLRERLEPSYFCPADTFTEPGVYWVTPRLRLVHDGAPWGLTAITGEYSGRPALVRISRGYRPHRVPSPGGESAVGSR